MFSVFVEQKLVLDGIYQLQSFDKEGVADLFILLVEKTLPYVFGIDDVLVFVHLYNSQDESLSHVGHFLFSQQQKLRENSFFFVSSSISLLDI